MNENNHTPRMTRDLYTRMYRESLEDPETFWSAQAEQFLTWYSPWDSVITDTEAHAGSTWFSGATLNVSYNCIDRHIEHGHGNQIAYHFEGNAGNSLSITYRDLGTEVSKLANTLKSRGVRKGDRVTIYMPMIPEAVYAMLACTRIGAIHTVVFAGFSSEALLSRVEDAGAVAIITADAGTRGDKTIPLLERVTGILPNSPTVHTVLVVNTTGSTLTETEVTVDYRRLVTHASADCPPEHMRAEDPLFILYTSGSTGKPKGVLHRTGGYLLYAAITHAYNFDYREGDVYWCAADVGWITGHTYMVYGPLANRATSVLFEGIPTYPDASRYWNVVDKYHVTTFYSTPTAIRALMAQGDAYVTRTSRKSLRILGSVGEPINPEAWRWYNEVVGDTHCVIVDTWWQTETGGHAIAPMPGVVDAKPGSAMIPFFGIDPVIVDGTGNEIVGEGEGTLLLRGSWPGQMGDLHNNHERFLDTYFKPYPGYYYTGDGARRDRDGHFWITGRVDDTMNIAGRLIGTAEVESALVLHPAVSEAAVVAVTHPITGSSIRAYVCLGAGLEFSQKLETELIELVKLQIGSFAKPEKIYPVRGLPKTRSGKIMRRILRRIAEGDTETLGDTSTLADPEVIEEIIQITKSHNLS